MLRKWIVAFSVLGLALPAGVFAQGFSQGDKELLLGASGASENDFDSNIFAIQGELGYFFTPKLEGSIRQAIRFSDTEGQDSTTNASTQLAADYHFDLGRLWPFVGASGGYVYGQGVSDTWELGLEGGLKYFVNNTTFILGRVEYQWFLDNDDDDSGGFSDGQWAYLVGIGFRW